MEFENEIIQCFGNSSTNSTQDNATINTNGLTPEENVNNTEETEGAVVPQTENNNDPTDPEVVDISSEHEEEHGESEASESDEIEDSERVENQRTIKCEKCNTDILCDDNLRAHNETVHPPRELNRTECTSCGFKAEDKQDLRRHIQTDHLVNRPCKEFMRNSCKYKEKCYYKHIQLNEGQCLCFSCGEIFENKTSLSTHIKTHHGNTVCKNFKRGACTFDTETCFYSHEVVHETNVTFLENNPTPTIPPENNHNMKKHIKMENMKSTLSGFMLNVGMKMGHLLDLI